MQMLVILHVYHVQVQIIINVYHVIMELLLQDSVNVMLIINSFKLLLDAFKNVLEIII